MFRHPSLIRSVAIAASIVFALAAGSTQAELVRYYGNANSGYLTLTELLGGGFIELDVNEDGYVDYTFHNWKAYDFSKAPAAVTVANPEGNIRVSAVGTYSSGSASATLNYTVVNNALRLTPPLPVGKSISWSTGVYFEYDIMSAQDFTILEQKDELTGASVVGPAAGTTSYASFATGNSIYNGETMIYETINETTLSSDGISQMTDTSLFRASSIWNTLDLRARRVRDPVIIVGTSEITSFSTTFSGLAPHAVPEPSSMIMGGLAGLTLLCKNIRRRCKRQEMNRIDPLQLQSNLVRRGFLWVAQ